MGVVYKGERVQLGRPVAVKFLHPWIAAQKTFRGRFENEARAMSRLAHPHCVSVIDFGVDGSPYLVMDYVTGTTLRDALREPGRLPSARALHLVRQLLAGLGHAHAQGIVHRDLKPENLILSEEAGLDEHLRILDFGLAKLRDGPAMTAGMAVGTPSYMSPEQTGAPGTIDARTDLYAVGVLLYELLSGRKPFESAQIGDLILMHRETPPPHIRQVAPEAGVSAEMEAVIVKAMAKLQEDRFQSAAEMTAALDATPEGKLRAELPRAPAVRPRPADATMIDSLSAIRRMAEVAAGEPASASAPQDDLAEAPTMKATVPAASPPRRLMRDPRVRAAAAGLLVFAVVALAFAIFRRGPSDGRAGSAWSPSGGAAAPGQPGPAPSGEPGGPAPSPTVAEAQGRSGVAEAQRLLHNGDWEQALAVLDRTGKEAPDDGDVDYLRAIIFLERHRVAEGLAAAQLAVHKNPALKGDGDLVNAVIASLASDKSYEASAAFLRGAGPAATPFIKEAARHDPSPKVRQRAAELLATGGARRSAPFGSSSASTSRSSTSRSSSSNSRSSKSMFSR
jgi:hypothetical protein